MRPNPFRTTIPTACPDQKQLFPVRNVTRPASGRSKPAQKRPEWTEKYLFWSVMAQNRRRKIILARKTSLLESSQR